MVDDDGRRWTPDHGHPISSPCESNGSGELKKDIKMFGLYPRIMFLKYGLPCEKD